MRITLYPILIDFAALPSPGPLTDVPAGESGTSLQQQRAEKLHLIVARLEITAEDLRSKPAVRLVISKMWPEVDWESAITEGKSGSPPSAAWKILEKVATTITEEDMVAIEFLALNLGVKGKAKKDPSMLTPRSVFQDRCAQNRPFSPQCCRGENHRRGGYIETSPGEQKPGPKTRYTCLRSV